MGDEAHFESFLGGAVRSEWPEPVDFLADEPGGVPKLEARHVPPAIYAFSTDTAERMGVDPTSVAVAALVAAASVVSDEFEIQPKRQDYTWTEQPRIWGAIVGDPSILKTPVISAATKPIDKLEAEARQRYQQRMREWKDKAAEAKQAGTAAPDQPKLERFMVEGTTTEALSEVLRDDDEAKMSAPAGKLLCRHDEMSEFFGSLDRYKSGGKGGADRGAYLRLYNGGRYTIDRIGRGSFAVPNWSACFLGGIQPGPIQRIARESAEDGLLQRLIYVVPEHQASGTDRAPDHDAVSRYGALFPALVSLHPVARIDGGNPQPHKFAEAAHEHREAINNLAAALAAMPDVSNRMKSALGKWPGLFARLCLLFHLIDTADARAQRGPEDWSAMVTGQTAQRVAEFMREILLPHLRRADAVMFSTDQTGHARWIAGFILAKRLDRVTTRDITRAYGALRPPEAKAELAATMDSLVAVGWLEPEMPDNPAKPVFSWLVNPRVHQSFADRAEKEARRRAEAKGLIAKAVAALKGERAAA